MSKEFMVKLTDTAHEDIEDIVRYIAHELKEPIAARNMHTKIVTSLKKLSNMPERHELVVDTHLHSLNVRVFYIGNYIAPYSILEEENVVMILRVLYARRD